MKNALKLITCSITITILLFVILTKADKPTITREEALKIGTEKYLEFLWMVDGAFNNERLNGEFIVNGKKLDNNNFTCKYKNKKDNTCVANNFEEEFKRIFASNISHDDVYSDGTYSWIKHEKGKYVFNINHNCSTSRMNLEQEIKLGSMDSKRMNFNIITKKDNNRVINRLFVLIKESNDWKISKAYYHDLCEMGYYIE